MHTSPFFLQSPEPSRTLCSLVLAAMFPGFLWAHLCSWISNPVIPGQGRKPPPKKKPAIYKIAKQNVHVYACPLVR